MQLPLIELPDSRRLPLDEIERSREHRAHYLSPYHGKGGEVKCLCRSDGIPLGVGHRSSPHDTYYLYPLHRSDPARHAIGCPHRIVEQQTDASEPASALPVVELRGERINLNIAAPLYRALTPEGEGDEETPEPSERTPTLAAKGKLRSLLEVLWSEAELNVWRPGFAGKRYYGVVSHRLREITGHLELRKHPLAPLLHIPPPYHPDREQELQAARDKWLANLKPNPKNSRKWFGYLVGILKTVQRANNAFVMKISHFPLPVHVEEKAWTRYADTWLGMEPQDTFVPKRPIAVVARIERLESAREARLELRDIAALHLSDDESWIPVESKYERVLVQTLVAAHRAFRKPLPIEDPTATIIPDVILEDRYDRLHMEVLGMMNHPYYASSWEDKRARYASMGQPYWSWDPQQVATVPPLPPPLARSAA